jgi:hypothetical protein|tara:strand:- start:83 stop:364 length:282 start_codon:yes stop_codon:yes gene_type:complete
VVLLSVRDEEEGISSRIRTALAILPDSKASRAACQEVYRPQTVASHRIGSIRADHLHRRIDSVDREDPEVSAGAASFNIETSFMRTPKRERKE